MEQGSPSPTESAQHITDTRTAFRAMLSKDFQVKGSMVMWPGGISASVEICLRAMAEQAGALETRQVQLERLVGALARTLHGFERQRRDIDLAAGTADLPDLPSFERWWEAMKSAHGF